MGWDNTNKRLSVDYPTAGTGISVDNIRTALNSTSRDVGTLCQSDSINLLSRHKPMRVNETGILTTAQKKAANYGYVFPTCSLIELLLLELYDVLPSGWTSKAADPNYRQLLNEWYYAKPRGAANNEWFRMLDFDGYKDVDGDSLIDANIPYNWVLGQSSSFYASLFQQDRSNMANFWQDSSYNAPMALSGFSNYALGIAVASSGLTQARLQASSAASQCGQWCKYQRFASPLGSNNYEVANADWLFLNTAGTYRIVPFLIGKNTAIAAYNNNGTTTLAESDVIPLPTPFVTCVVSNTPTPTESFSISGRPTYSTGARMTLTFRIAYTSGLQNSTFQFTITQYSGTTVVNTYTDNNATFNGSGTGSTRYVSFEIQRSWTTVSNMRIAIVVSKSGYPSSSKDFIQEIPPIE